MRLDSKPMILDDRAFGESSRRFGVAAPRRRFIFSSLFAIAVSVGAHYAAFTYAEFSFTANEDPDFGTETRELVTLTPEDPTPLDRTTIEEAFAPANPDLVAETSTAIDPLDSALDSEPPELESVDLNTELQGMETATLTPDAPRPDTQIDPRREIIQINEKLFNEDVSLLPRRLTADIPRQIDAPDITTPVSMPDLSAMQNSASANFDTSFRPKALSLPPLSPLPIVPDSVTARAETLLPAPTQRPEAAAAGLSGERASDVVKHHAVENLLELKVNQFLSPQEPEFVYFKVTLERNGIESLPVLPKSVILLQDCSLSITEAKLEQFKQGLYNWLDTIRPGDFFNVIAFSDGVNLCFENLTRMDPSNRAAAKWFISNLKAQGKTDVFASLQKLLKMVNQSPVPVVGILLTDGRPTVGLRDSTSIIEKFTQAGGGKLSVFCVGGGSRANEYMLDLLSYRNRGDSIIVPRNDALAGAMVDMAGQLRHPVLADLQYTFTGAVNAEVYPFTLTHLYLDRALEIYGRAPRNAGPLAFQIVGKSIANRTKDMVFKIDPEAGTPGEDEIRRKWAWHKMYHLIGIYLKTKNPDDLLKIRQMAAKYDLRVPYVYDLEGKAAPVDIRPGTVIQPSLSNPGGLVPDPPR